MTMAYAPLSAGRRPQRGHNTHTHKPTIRQSLGKPRRVRRTAFPGILTSIGWCLSLGVVSAGLLQILTVFLVGSGLLFTGQSSILAPGDYFGTGGLPILIVGGTDGSGTRAFVDTLRRLGVPILFDDPSTFDIHARELFDQQGWPSLIDLVISHTHSANYEWDDLPPDAQQILQQEIPKLLRGLKGKLRRASLLEKKMFHHHRKITPKARGVAFAIKAPVAMLVLPVLTKFVGKIKFLHVLRE